MKTHSLLGIEIVQDNPWLKGAALTIRYHREHFDGSGYPEGLRGEAIPLTPVYLPLSMFLMRSPQNGLTKSRRRWPIR